MSEGKRHDSTFLVLILGLVGFLFGFGFLINRLGRLFDRRIPRRLYRIVEISLIGAITLGIAGMFQPWVLWGFRWGFLLLFYATLAYIVWSHLVPEPMQFESPETGKTVEQIESRMAPPEA